MRIVVPGETAPGERRVALVPESCKKLIPGFAGIDNELYFADRTWMLFGDAKNVIGELVKQLAGGSGAH